MPEFISAPEPAHKSPGQVAYEQDCLARPTYDTGQIRIAWAKLGAVERSTWEKNPTPRWQAPST